MADNKDKLFSELEEEMNKTILSLKKQFGSIRTGRASSSILDRIEIEYYGSMTSVKNVANITTPDARTVMITPFEKNIMGLIEKAILKSDIGITPANDGQAIRLAIQPLTQERRKDLAKTLKKIAEDCKVAIRNERRNAVDRVKKMEKDGIMSEDESKKSQDKTQKMTDKYVAEIDKLTEAKEKEIMEI
jgi:ribosome recycling factor